MKKLSLYFNVFFLSLFLTHDLLAQTTRRSGSSGAPTQRRGDSSGSSSRDRDHDQISSRSDRSMDRSRQTPTTPTRERTSSNDTYSRDTYRPSAEPTRIPRQSPSTGTVRRSPRNESPRSEQPRTEVPRQRPDITTNQRGQNGERNHGGLNRQTPRRSDNSRHELPQDGYATPSRSHNHDRDSRISRGVHSERRRDYGSSHYHRPYGHDRITINHSNIHRHHSHNHHYRHRVILTPSVYYRHLYVNASACYYYDWIYCYTSRSNGFYIIDSYPFYVYNGYYHRYSDYDTCNYQLIDSFTRRVKNSYWGSTCRSSYDRCALERDILNIREMYHRFTCAETYRPRNYSYFNTFNDNEYRIGGYNETSTEDYYENDDRSPEYDSYNNEDINQSSEAEDDFRSNQTSAHSQDNEVLDEVSPVLGSMTDLGSSSTSSQNGQRRRNATSNNDTQDY